MGHLQDFKLKFLIMILWKLCLLLVSVNVYYVASTVLTEPHMPSYLFFITTLWYCYPCYIEKGTTGLERLSNLLLVTPLSKWQSLNWVWVIQLLNISLHCPPDPARWQTIPGRNLEMMAATSPPQGTWFLWTIQISSGCYRVLLTSIVSLPLSQEVFSGLAPEFSVYTCCFTQL